MKRFAFTLSEVLLTLSIIGVVAALTIPTLVTNMSDRSNIVKLEATIKSLNDAVNNLMIAERVTDISDSSLADTPSVFFSEYLNSSMNCDDENFSSCFASSYTGIDGTGIGPFTVDADGDDALLPSGAAIQLMEVTAGENAGFFIDVNGPEGPNVAGRDLFMVRLFQNGMVGSDSDGKELEDIQDDCNNGSTYGLDCLYLLEKNGWKMDY